MAYQLNGNVIIDDDGNGFFENLPVILTPSILEPLPGEEFVLGSNVQIVATDFDGVYSTFFKSEFQVANNISFAEANIVFSANIIPGANAVFSGAGNTVGNSFARVRYFSSDNTASEFSATREFYVEEPPSVLGQTITGGYYMGTVDIGGGTCYYIVVSPNATGCACCQFKTSRTNTGGCNSSIEGYTRTYNTLNSSTFPAGNFTATRTISGFDDWYLPAYTEHLLLYTNQANLPAGEAFCAERYWTSFGEYLAPFFGHCNFHMGNGGTNNQVPDFTYRVRSIRRIPVL